jgi:hypothetical protein
VRGKRLDRAGGGRLERENARHDGSSSLLMKRAIQVVYAPDAPAAMRAWRTHDPLPFARRQAAAADMQTRSDDGTTTQLQMQPPC